MNWLSNEEVKIPHLRLTVGMFLMLLVGVFLGCQISYKSKKTAEPTIKTVVVHDTTIVEKHDGGASLKGTITTLLIQYYKAGLMDASNGIIDLNNAGRFDNKNVDKIKYKDWRKMENEVMSK